MSFFISQLNNAYINAKKVTTLIRFTRKRNLAENKTPSNDFYPRDSRETLNEFSHKGFDFYQT